MKKYILLIFVCSMSILRAQKSSKITYKIIPPSIKETFISKKLPFTEKDLEIFELSEKVLRKFEYTLSYTHNESIFTLNPIAPLEGKEGKILTDLLKGRFANSIYYVNTSENLTLEQLRKVNTFLLHIPFEEMKWKLHEESKKIQGYTCYKATLRHNIPSNTPNGYKTTYVEAWYAPSLPHKYGPLEYNNLPGLIIELTQGKYTFIATSIALNLKNEILIKKPTKGIKMSKETYVLNHKPLPIPRQ